MSAPVLSIEGLQVDWVTDEGPVRAVDGASLSIGPGEVHGLVGESGCGKSTLARAALRVLGPPAVVRGGRVLLEGTDLLDLDDQALAAVRWTRISMVFQSALDALNPVLRVRDQLTDAAIAHGVDAAEAGRRAEETIGLVGLPPRALEAYPHQLSGGMRQRVVIAMALVLKPAVMVLDEPTTALDVVVQAEILAELARLKNTLGFSMLFITHDLPMLLETCDTLTVMYAGRVVESAPVAAMRAGPRHPYTRALLGAFARLDGPRTFPEGLPGAPPSLAHPPDGCRFHPRCALATDVCRTDTPALVTLGTTHRVACHHAEG